jgi:multiple antibiotic resistance protein
VSESYLVNAGQIFTLFFVMLGPLKMLGPFAKASHSLTPEKLRTVSVNAVILSLISLIIGGYLGNYLLSSWGIPISVLELTSGIIFFVMALMMIVLPHKEAPVAVPSTPQPDATAPGVAFSMIVTPYGMAVIVGLLAMSASLQRTILILGLLVLVLVLDLLAMIYIRKIMGKTGMLIMQMVGAAFAVLQASLAIQMIIIAVRIFKSETPL